MTEYCRVQGGSRCESVYLLGWPLLACFTVFVIHLIRLFWKSKSDPWHNVYGVSTKRSLRIDGHKPGKVHSCELKRNFARIDWFGDVRFDGSRTGLAFHALDELDAKRAVYWANEGRFRGDILEPAI